MNDIRWPKLYQQTDSDRDKGQVSAHSIQAPSPSGATALEEPCGRRRILEKSVYLPGNCYDCEAANFPTLCLVIAAT